MSRTVVAVVALAVLVASPGVATAVVGVLDDGTGAVPGVDEISGSESTSASTGVGGSMDAGTAEENGTNGSVAVTTGSQLSTVLATTEDEVGTAVSTSSFDSRFATANESERARLVAARADNLTERAAAVAQEFRTATAAYENGTIDRSTYAQRLATLNARARTIRASIDHLQNRAATVSDLELATAGYDAAALEAAREDVETVTSAGPSAIHRRFTGESNGSVKVEADNGTGVSFEFESEAGERSLEVRGPADDDPNLTVSGEDALATARDALSNHDWTLRESSVHEEDGYFKFEFGFESANETGEAAVRVDGSSGNVLRLEEEIEPRDDDDDRDDGPPLVLIVADGEPAPGATVTIQARRGGEPVPNATVAVDDATVGTTDDDGRLAVTLGVDETEVTAEHGDDDAELEFEFEHDDGPRLEGLNVTAILQDDIVTVSVTYEGDGVPGTQVAVNGDRVGPTGPNGTVSFAYDGAEDLELEITRGEFELERTYRVENGTLVASESEGDDGDDEDARELNLSVVEGDPAPNATVTVEATIDGEPTAGVQVFVDGEIVGPTDADGRIDVTLGPEDTDVSAERGDLEAELEFDFDDGDGEADTDENETDEGDRELDLAVVEGEPAPNATVTVEATIDGDPTAGVRVFVEGDRVGTTGADGRIDVTLGADDTTVTAERDDLDAKLEFEFDDEDDENGTDDDTDDTGNGSQTDGT